MPNQYKPLPPDDVLRPWVEYYWQLGLNDNNVVDNVRDHIDAEIHGFSVASLKRKRREWGLHSTRQQKHSIESINAAIQDIRSRFPSMGARSIVNVLRQDYGDMRVPEQVVAEYLKLHEPEAVQARIQRRWKRKRFWSAGVNDVIAVDQHDKWQRFGLFFHIGVEPFAGRIVWLKVWWTNRNPRLIASYYIEAGRQAKGVPLVTQSDPGTENYGIANCHTNIRHRLDPSLANTLQHRWMRKKANIKPEIAWAGLRRTWSEGFENILDAGHLNGLYDPDDPIEKLLFRWLAVPWIQAELDAYRRRFNTTPRRADRSKVLPHGIPDMITAKPERFGSCDFKVNVPAELFDEMELKWAPPDHAVFDLVPSPFAALMDDLYEQFGSPAISSHNFWDIYVQLLHALHAIPQDYAPLMEASQTVNREDEREAGGANEIALLPNLQNLRYGAAVIGNAYVSGLAEDAARLASQDRRHHGNLSDGSSSEEDEDRLGSDDRLFASFTQMRSESNDDNLAHSTDRIFASISEDETES